MSGGAVRKQLLRAIGRRHLLHGGDGDAGELRRRIEFGVQSTGEGGGIYNGGTTLTLVNVRGQEQYCRKARRRNRNLGFALIEERMHDHRKHADNLYAYYGYTSDGTSQIGTSPNKSATAFSGYSGETEPEPRSIIGDADVAQVKKRPGRPASDVFRAVSAALSQDLGGVSGDATATLSGMTGVALLREHVRKRRRRKHGPRRRIHGIVPRAGALLRALRPADGSGYELPDRGVQFELQPGQALPTA